MGVHETIASHYAEDARHFLQRYQLLRIEDFNKAGRVKNFMDVVMAAECALKAHIFLDSTSINPVDVYREVKKLSHSVGNLADRANLVADRTLYDAVKNRLGDLSIRLRYSLDMWETYFPSFGDEAASRTYDETLANTAWRTAAIKEAEALLVPFGAPSEVTGSVEDILNEANQMRIFAESVGIRPKA